VKCVDGLALLAKEGMVMQGVIDKRIEIGRCYGMEMNVRKQSNENFKTTISSNGGQKQRENVDFF
jgi:hypothetical protein